MAPINVGVSELPGRTFDKMQVMTNVQAGLNLRAAIFELEHEYGEVVTVNEADRSRPDQDLMYAQMPITGILAAKPYTSTHDAVRHGDAADMALAGGKPIGGTRAHRLLDGNHPEGVVGRKWGIYNTGAYFWKPESWHFNIFPARAERLATLADSTPKPTPKPKPRRKNEDDMQVIWNDKKTAATVSAGTGNTVIDERTPKRGAGRDVDWKQQIKICERVSRIDPASSYPGGLNDTELAVYRQILNSMKG